MNVVTLVHKSLSLSLGYLYTFHKHLLTHNLVLIFKDISFICLQEREKLKELSQKQAKTQMLQRHLQPSSRLLLDPMLARDLEEKLTLKQKLEQELSRLKQVYGREAGD